MGVATRSGKRVRSPNNTSSAKRVNLANLPKNFLVNLVKKLPRKNAAMLAIASPRSNVRHALKPTMNKYKKIENLRRKISFRGNVNSLRVNPAYIQIVRRLQELNNTPNNNYEMRGNTSTGRHTRRIQAMQNLINRLQFQGANMYWNRRNNKNYEFNRGSLIAVPNNPHRPYITIAKGLSKRPNGTLFFNVRKRHDRKRNRTH